MYHKVFHINSAVFNLSVLSVQYSVQMFHVSVQVLNAVFNGVMKHYSPRICITYRVHVATCSSFPCNFRAEQAEHFLFHVGVPYFALMLHVLVTLGS